MKATEKERKRKSWREKVREKERKFERKKVRYKERKLEKRERGVIVSRPEQKKVTA